MKSINYRIQFFAPWHCSSGQSAGADVDTTVIKDKNGLPYIPGKTLKGLIREAVVDYGLLRHILTEEDINRTFGLPADASNPENNIIGEAFFTDALLDEQETKAITQKKAQQFMYDKVASTAIDEKGVAKDLSLRSIEIVVACTLYAQILNIPDKVADVMDKALGMIHQVGLNRNRGLGRCDIRIIEKGGKN